MTVDTTEIEALGTITGVRYPPASGVDLAAVGDGAARYDPGVLAPAAPTTPSGAAGGGGGIDVRACRDV